MADLTPAEQAFFETGQLQPGMAPEPPTTTPVDLAGLGNATPEPPAVAPPPAQLVHPEPPPQQQSPEVAELLRRSLADAQQRIADLETHARLTQQRVQPPQEEPAPDPDIDPLGAMMHKLNQLNKQILELQTHQQATVQQQSAAQTFQAFKEQVGALRDQFIQQHPDFEAAYNHVRAARVADLQIFGFNQRQIDEALFREEIALAESAIRNARNPAEVIYQMAQRHGYVPRTAPAPAAPAAAARLEQIQAAQAAARTLPAQQAPDTDLSVETLKNASDADLNRIILDPKAWSKLTGADQYPL